jgi:pimeloyl-ACP methyl ester carboxylesterase
MRSFFGAMFVADPAIATLIFERGISLPAPTGRALITNLAGWDAGEVEAALDCVAVPVLAIQTTTMGTARQRISLQPGQSSPWLDLIRARVAQVETVTLFGSGHFPQIERSDEVNALIAGFARL